MKEATEVVNESDSTKKTLTINYDFIISPETVRGDFRTFLQGVVSTYDKVLIKNGTYEIEVLDRGGVKPKNGCTITFEPNAKIKVKPNNFEVYSVFNLSGRKDITFWNPTLEGDKYTHKGSTGEWGHGISLMNCSNITIHNANISKFWGDGLYFNGCSNVKIHNPILDDNRREGITIISCENVDIYNPIISNTTGTSPAFGIDIEPNFNGEHVKALKIYNAVFRNNAQKQGKEYPAGFALSTHQVDKSLAPNKKQFVPTIFDIELINPTFYGDALLISVPGNNTHGKIIVKNPMFYETRESALFFYNHQSNNFKTEIINPTLTNCVTLQERSIYYVPILFRCSDRAVKTTGSRNILIKNPKIIADNKAKYRANAIRNITPSKFTEDMRDVAIENLVVNGYEIPFLNNRGGNDQSTYSILHSKFSLSLNKENSKLPNVVSEAVVSKTLNNSLINFRENTNDPIIYLNNDIPISGFELYYANNSVNKVPLKLIFGTKTSPTKKMVQKTGETQRSSNGITIPYGAHVTLIKKGANSWEIIKTKSSNNVTY
ncbi:MAG: right-handed parallel beta-helix repeat-containing protein [Capnocytophaga sp.]|nr:right-handed parallel beta-helix repeat-containing protein [Capnocytophaga sp.]